MRFKELSGSEPQRRVQHHTETPSPRDKSPVAVESPAGRTISPELAATKQAGAPEAHAASLLSARVDGAKFERHRKGELPMTAEAFAGITGIEVDANEAERLDAVVRKVAERMGIEHDVGYANEVSYMGIFEYAFVGMFKAWERPAQPIRVGVGVKAESADDLNLLAKHWYRGADLPQGLRGYLEDFVELSEEERIESLLVHEKLELDAIGWGSSEPHHAAVAGSPKTSYSISPRTRKHLELYAQLNRRVYGEVA